MAFQWDPNLPTTENLRLLDLSSRGLLDSSAVNKPTPAAAGVQWPGPGVGRLTLQGPDGSKQTLDSGEYQKIGQLTGSGWVPLNEQGQPYRVVPYAGGQMFMDPARPGQAFPLNELLGGQKTPEQQAAMGDFWKTIGGQPAPPTPGSGVGQTTTMPSGLSAGNFSGMDFQGLINALIGESIQQGKFGQTQMQGLHDNLYEVLDMARQREAQRTTQQDALVQQLMGTAHDYDTRKGELVNSMYDTVAPILGSAQANQNVGLDPSVQAALNTQAMDTSSHQFGMAEDALKSRLLRSGAMGGEGPGSLGDIMRGYGELESQRVGLQSQLQQQGILANQSALQQNRANALQAAGLGSSFAGTLGQLYNPSTYFGAAQGLGQLYDPSQYLGAIGNTLNTGVGIANAGTQAGLGGLQNATGLMQALANQQSGNSGIGPALIGAAGSMLGPWLASLNKQNPSNSTNPGNSFMGDWGITYDPGNGQIIFAPPRQTGR